MYSSYQHVATSDSSKQLETTKHIKPNYIHTSPISSLLHTGLHLKLVFHSVLLVKQVTESQMPCVKNERMEFEASSCLLCLTASLNHL